MGQEFQMPGSASCSSSSSPPVLKLVLVKLLQTVKLPGNCQVPGLISGYELLIVRVSSSYYLHMFYIEFLSFTLLNTEQSHSFYSNVRWW
jgi:hypothetical protein